MWGVLNELSIIYLKLLTATHKRSVASLDAKAFLGLMMPKIVGLC